MSNKTRIINIKKNPQLVGTSNYKYIGRGSIYGNPFSHIDMSTALIKVASRDEAVDFHNEWLDGKRKVEIDDPENPGQKIEIKPPTIEQILELKNCILGCFCAPLRCHGSNYIRKIEEFEKEKEIKEKDLF